MNTLLRTLLLLLLAGIGFGSRSAKAAADKTFLGLQEVHYMIAGILLGIIIFGSQFIIYRKHKTIQSIGFDTLPTLFLAVIAFLWISLLIIRGAIQDFSVLMIICGAAVMAYPLLLLFAAWRHIRSKAADPNREHQ